MQALSIQDSLWIGLRKHESLWLWVNGEYAAPAAIYWVQDKLNKFGLDKQCGHIRVNMNRNQNYGTVGGNCSKRRIALCEKKYLPNN